MAPVFFNCIFFAQIIRAKVPAHTKTITEMPIKKYFTFIAPRINRYAIKKQSPTEYRELKSDQTGNKNYPATSMTPAQNSVRSYCQTALMYA